MSEYLFELLLEEMPPADIEMILNTLETNLKDALEKARIDHGKIDVFSTPRRFGFLIHDIALTQHDATWIKKGPSENVAFKDRKPTKALEGFLKSNNAQISDIEISESEGGKYVFLKKFDQGMKTKEVLPQTLLTILNSFRFTRPMKWGNGEFSYTRPVHSIISIIDEEIVPFEFMGKKASNVTKSHRYLDREVTVRSAGDYEKIMKESMVVIRTDEREKMILDEIKNCDLEVMKDDDLVHEISMITEYPQPVIGQFKTDYLTLPEPVLRTVLRHHQRTFITKKNGKVSKEFLAFQDGPASRTGNVKNGYERVINARLSDAKFYQTEDLKYPLDHFNEKLADMTFQKNLGTLMDKVERIKEIALKIGTFLNFGAQELKLVERAAILSKSDLGTSMIYEFPELQGIMGSIYAKNEDPRIALAIKEQYVPDGLEGEFPSDTIGAVIGIADRIDTVVANFAIGEIPSGSRDPYALRKKVFAILRILNKFEWDLDLKEIISIVENILGKKVSMDSLTAFFKGRLDVILRENLNISQDVSKAVLELWNKPFRSTLSAQVVEKSRKEAGFEDFIIAYTRVHNISKSHDSFEYHVDLFDDHEKKLFSAYIEAKPKVEEALEHLNYEEAFEHLRSLKSSIDEYFDNVFVMSPREDLRLNRLGFLKNLDQLFLNFGDLSLLLKNESTRG